MGRVVLDMSHRELRYAHSITPNPQISLDLHKRKYSAQKNFIDNTVWKAKTLTWILNERRKMVQLQVAVTAFLVTWVNVTVA